MTCPDTHPERGMAVPGRHGYAAELAYVAFMLGVTPLASVAALALAATHGLSAFQLLLFLGYLLLSTFGVTAGLHRLFSHRAFRCSRGLEIALAVLGTAAGQDFFIRWVYVHRLHHRYTDGPGDPHSPWYDGERPLGLLSGLWHAHNGWLFRREPAVRPELVKDLLRDPVLLAVDRWSPAITLAGVLLPGLLALLYEASWLSFATGVLWAGFLRLFIMYQLGWGVNSVGHRFGARMPGQTHQARNNWALGLIALGEGWHANHHEYAAAARHGRGYQLDLTWLALLGLQRLGWVHGLRQAPGGCAVRFIRSAGQESGLTRALARI